MVKSWCMVCLWSVLQILKVSAFNLDTENVLQRSGDPGSLFGFSVAFHQQLSPTRKKLLLVGAPRSKHLNQVNVTGVVYQCDLTTTSEHCQPIEFDSEEFLDSKGVNGQWMGIRVTSQGPGQNVMACAHRYQQWSPRPSDTGPHLVLTGQCYLLGNDLKVGKEHRSWRRVVCDSEHLGRRHNDHQWFRYCQQGHGASFAKDNRSLVFGAPGAYQWKGVVRLEELDNEDIDNLDEVPRETGDIDLFNPKLIPLQDNSYLGFSTDSGMALIRKGELTIVSGAPRGGYSGQVAFLKKDPVAKRSLSVEFVLSDPGLASSFGYDVAVVDFNGDGWEDLAVGAPQFFVKNGTVGGAVYIYINNKGKNWEDVVPTQLLGHTGSMFGLAVENIGDINQDGYGDIAVGAPYHGDGRVYIYCGSSNGIHKNPAQVLTSGSDKVKLFGYSLSGNLDVDDNQYPDLAVGSLSDSVFVYRARPVVSISSSLQVTPNEIDITKEQCDKKTCVFAAQACFSYTAHPALFNSKLMVNYTFEADTERRKARLPPRINFRGSPRGKLELSGQGRKICTDTELRLLRNIIDKLHSIPISVSVSLWGSSPTSEASAGQPSITPVLNLYQNKTTNSKIILINKGCGSDNICQSNLELQHKFCSRNTYKNQDVYTSLAREDGVAVITPSNEDIALEITVTNRNGDDAHQSHINITLPETLHYTSVVYNTAEITFYVMLTTSRISLSTKNVNVTMQLQTTSVQTIPPVEALARVAFELKMQVYGKAKPSQVSLTETLIGESAIKSVDEIGTPVQYEFRIMNQGRSLKSFANASLNIYWPKENSVGKWLLYLTQITSKGVQSVSCSPVHEINPLKHVKTCSDGLKCVEIRCPLLDLDSTAAIVLHTRLWNTTFTEDYSSLNYLDIVVDASISLNNSPENIALKPEKPMTKVRLTVFLDKKTEILTKVAWWIILLTVIALLLTLAAFGYLMWKHEYINCLPHNKKLSDDKDPESAPLKG
ncbi:hypothetical protein INR49_013541 [Caranx melampygus]|nr:hypothetical protein INR49_013541 [Caranx melampygus]